MDIRDMDTMNDILEQLLDESISVSLDSGEQVEGVLTKKGRNLIYISRLSGREFYDAIIRIDRVSTVTYRAREVRSKS